MTLLTAGLMGFLMLVVGLLVRVLAAVALLGLLAAPVFVAVFGWYWLTLVYDGVVGIRRVGHLFWRRDSYYTPGHLWLRPMRLQTVRVGVDDIAQRVLQDIESIALPDAGTRVRQGEPIADITCGHDHVVLRAPVAGTITDANPRLLNAPAMLHRDPYRRGWVVEIKPLEARFDGCVAGGQARAWLAKEEQRLTGFFERALGMAAADGGELIHATPEAITNDQWSDIRAAFLDTAARVDRDVEAAPLSLASA